MAFINAAKQIRSCNTCSNLHEQIIYVTSGEHSNSSNNWALRNITHPEHHSPPRSIFSRCFLRFYDHILSHPRLCPQVSLDHLCFPSQLFPLNVALHPRCIVITITPIYHLHSSLFLQPFTLKNETENGIPCKKLILLKPAYKNCFPGQRWACGWSGRRSFRLWWFFNLSGLETSRAAGGGRDSVCE